jgi:hypothetical protein
MLNSYNDDARIMNGRNAGGDYDNTAHVADAVYDDDDREL